MQTTAGQWKKFDKGVSFLCWAYNEELLMRDFLFRADRLLRETVEDYEIVVVDDGSTDRTQEIIRLIQSELTHIRLLENPRNLDCGLSLARAVQAATKEYLFWQTVDWAYDISSLRTYLEFLREYDIVTGARSLPVREADRPFERFGGLQLLRLFRIRHITRRSDNIPKALVSLVNYGLIRLLFGVPLSDFQNVTIYPTRLLQPIGHEATSSFANPEGLMKCYWKGARIIEVPISFLPRRVGRGKGTRMRALFASTKDIFRLWFKWVLLGKRNDAGTGTIEQFHPGMLSQSSEQGVEIEAEKIQLS